jgi:hypothetical protein
LSRRGYDEGVSDVRIAWIAGKQANEPIDKLQLARRPALLGEVLKGMGHDLLDVLGQRRISFSGINLPCDDAGTPGIEAQEPSLQALRQ